MMEFFIGRFHPMIVHLPIGFIVLAFVLETLAVVRKTDRFRDAILISCLVAVGASFAAVVSGWMLSESGAYAPDPLSTHKWLGISVLILSAGWFLVKWKIPRPRIQFAMAVLVMAIVSLAGHYGGSLTHGENYLFEYAPGFLAGFMEQESGPDLAGLSPDSILVYADIVRPILEKKCMDCHSGEEPAGGFNAAYFHTLFEETESGTPVVPGNLASSELFQRITLPAGSRKFMPPNGHPVSYSELNVIRHWIESGADSAARFDHTTMNDELIRLVDRDYGLDYTPRPYFERVTLDSLPAARFAELQDAGFKAAYLGAENYLLDISFTGDTLRENALEVFSDVPEYVCFLDLSELVIEPGALNSLPSFSNLMRIDLHGAHLPPSAFTDFQELLHLEVVNLHHTAADYSALNEIMKAPSLERLYLWETGISADTLEIFRSEYAGIEFVSELGLELPADSSSVALTENEE